MKKKISIVSWLIMICMVMSLMCSVATAAAELPFTLDDADVTVTPVGGNAYEAHIPDGRPRVPQIVAQAGDKLTQAFLPDSADRATATLTRAGVTYTVTFVKDAALGFVLQYDDHYVFDPGFSGAAFSSSDTTIAPVNVSTGEITVKKVSNTPVTITATKSGQIKKLVITKTIRAVLSIWMLTGQSNAAINYGDYSAVSAIPQKGTAYFYGGNSTSAHIGCRTISPMTLDDGSANFGNIEPSMAKALYEKLGEKNLILNTAIAGTGIGKFLPGNTAASDNTWNLINTLYEGAYAEWTADSFQANYETRMRSFFFCQGCAEVGSYWETHYNGFAVNTNTDAFTTLGKNYAAGTHTFFTYMTKVLGFENCLDIMVSWRPVGITASTRTAQFKLAENFDNYYIISRVNQTFSLEEGTYRFDNLHYTQAGRDIVGANAGGNAAALYAGKVLETATKATAYFNKIGYDNGQTVYVRAGDFYNYCTRPYPYSADNGFMFRFVGGDDIVDFDGQNDFVIKKTATPGSSCLMQIYNPGESTPLTEITLQVVGTGATGFTEQNVNTYSWDFSSGSAVTTAGGISLTKASDKNSGFSGKSAMELSEDLWLDSDGYWSMEWKASNIANTSMIASSADQYSKTIGDAYPNFIFVYYTTGTNTGWKIYRDTAYTDNFWRHSTKDFDYSGTHTYKLECRDNVYTFSIDGVISDSREIIEGHGSYAAGASHTPKGYFDNRFNLHYLLGGINQNGLSSTKYGFNGDVSYVTITIGDENPAIKKVLGTSVSVTSGNGTAEQPYVINTTVSSGTTVTESSFTANVPAGTLALSADKFGGKALTSTKCVAGTTPVYAMALGALPYQSTFYKINLNVSPDDPALPENLCPDRDVFVIDPTDASANGTVKSYDITGTEYNFIKGYNFFADIGTALSSLPSDGKLYLLPGSYAGNYTVDKNVRIFGANHGVNPNAEVISDTLPALTAAWGSGNSTLTGQWTVADGCGDFVMNGVVLSGTVKDSRTAAAPTDVFLQNVVIDSPTAGKVISLGSTEKVLNTALTVEHLRAVGTDKQIFDTACQQVTVSGCVFNALSAPVDTPHLAFVAKEETIGALSTYTVSETYFGGITAPATVKVQYDNVSSPSAGKYSEISVLFIENVFDGALSGTAETILDLRADTEAIRVVAFGNHIYTDGAAGTAQKSFIYGCGSQKGTNLIDRRQTYSIEGNAFFTDGTELPMVFDTDTTDTKNHNNICLGAVYSEIGNAAVSPNANTTVNTNTAGRIVSTYTKYAENVTCTAFCDEPLTMEVPYKAPSPKTAGHEPYYIKGDTYYSDDSFAAPIDSIAAWLSEGGEGYIEKLETPDLFDLTLTPIGVSANETGTGYFDVSWDVDIVLNTSDPYLDGKSDINVISYGIYCASSEEPLLALMQDETPQGKYIQNVFQRNDGQPLTKIYKNTHYKLLKVAENRFRYAMCFIEYELDGETMYEYSRIDCVSTVLGGTIIGDGGVTDITDILDD